MKCTELIFDKRMKKTRVCGAEIRGMTGLQEIQNFQKHLRTRHKDSVPLETALEMRAESGQ